MSPAILELRALRRDLEEAADAILTAVETALAEPAAAPEALQTILAACAFQDLAGQRLSKIERLVAGETVDDSGLENGPALAGRGLGQAAADALFE